MDIQVGSARSRVKSATLTNTGTRGCINAEIGSLDQPGAGVAGHSGDISHGAQRQIFAASGFNRTAVAVYNTTFCLKRDPRPDAGGLAASHLDRTTVAVITSSIGS